MGDILGPSIAEAEKYENARIGFRAAFMDYLERDADPAGKSLMPLATKTQSSGPSEEYIFIGDLPGFEEWKDDRKMGELAAHKITVANKNWASGVRVHRNEIMDDKLGIVGQRIQGLARKAKRHPDDFLAKLLINGFAGTTYPEVGDGLAYTGQLFFSNSHTLEGGEETIDNLGATAFSETALESTVQAMREYRTWDDKDPLDVNPSHIIVGPKLEFTAKRLVGQTLRVRTAGDGGDTNIHYGAFEVIVSPRLVGTYDDYWFLADLTQAVKPLIFQEREAITTAAQVDWSSDDMFKRGQMNFGAQARYGGGYFDPRLIFGHAVA
jgi:phage major head subunit gpT-like protein